MVIRGFFCFRIPKEREERYMITLENVSVKRLMLDSKILKLANKANVNSVEDIVRLSIKYPEYNWTKLFIEIDQLKKSMALANKRGYEPQVYTTKGYTDETLEKQDEKNMGSVLLLDNPTQYSSCRFSALKERSIATIKQDLSHTFEDGRNYLQSYYRNIGLGHISKMLEAIEMYEAQMERQAKLTDDINGDLFRLHRMEKIAVVMDMYNEIVNYLVFNAEESLFWAKLTETQKRKYLSSIVNQKESDLRTRKRLTKMIADYTTILELEDVANHDLHILQRFIVK